jgi:hypothetical protein
VEKTFLEEFGHVLEISVLLANYLLGASDLSEVVFLIYGGESDLDCLGANYQWAAFVLVLFLATCLSRGYLETNRSYLVNEDEL